ncbi:hypothetical protein GPX89_08535 [Nocardia sp. ET3-3]|uniref:Uncharacterized protein n=1 Tax=Nocardia terrae TaxID=2675851 RepID=A0A7K1USN3_9NOCA|nr:hypothetical protein [Nocardia terrae]MVU77291.1 hypothetical protein [Nocardia terrae]
MHFRQLPARSGQARNFPPPRTHVEEGIEDLVNFLGVILSLLAIVALALALVADGYGFAGWAIVAGVACALLFAASLTVLGLERRARHTRERSDPPARQGH